MKNKSRERARIALMLPRLSLYGGVEQFGFRLARGLAERGHQVDFICSRQEVAPPSGVRVISVGRPWGPRFLKMLWFLIQAERVRKTGAYDMTISLGKTWRQDLVRMGGGPLTVFWEKSELSIPPGPQRVLKRLTRRLSLSNLLTILLEKRQFTGESRVIAVSHLVRKWLLEAYPALDRNKVSVVYNRPDAARFSPPAPGEREKTRAALLEATGLSGHFSERDGELVFIGTASTNFRLKGVDRLIRALALLPENTLLFVAGGRDASQYRALARSLNLDNRVAFTGKTDNMPSFYRALDLFALPTFYDACSNAVLEALACGCRTITSAANGASFFLECEAILPDPADVEDLARRIRILAAKPAPAPFVWSLAVKSGLEAFIDEAQEALREKTAMAIE
ncbi:MAG: glycosyltransferase family 4 protein [Desulfovibrio sp.]|jgi:UDP-glucose:(heptosyl)LPS alpha-1,3-glucosyltransferase|nr:glycosyltransferase family 4 protein [Desulfovibrio sp.]